MLEPARLCAIYGQKTTNQMQIENAALSALDRPAIVFVGGMATATRHSLRLLASEYPDTDFRHVAGARELAQMIGDGVHVRMAILDETLVDVLIAAPGAFFPTQDVRLVLAYRDPAAAVALMGAARAVPELAGMGLLPLNVPVEVWMSLIHLLLCGEIVYPRAMVDALVGPACAPSGVEGSTGEDMPAERLTPREWEVLTKVALGQQNKRIAVDMAVSEHTVKLHVHNVLRKLGVTNRTGAARWYAVHGAAS